MKGGKFMSIVSQEQFVILKFNYKDFSNIKKLYKKFHDINSKKYIAVYKQGLYGILELETEKLVVPFKYQRICDFKEGFAWVKAKNKWGFINKSLEEIVPPKFTDVFGLDNGSFDLGIIHCVGAPTFDPDNVNLSKLYKESRKLNPPIVYNRIEGFSEGFAPVKFRKKWGFIDITGEISIKSRFDDVKPFSFGVAAVCLKSKWGFIDKSGNFIIKPQYEDCSSFRKPSLGLVKRELKRPASKNIFKYIYSMLKKVYVPNSPITRPLAQVELPSDDTDKIKIADIDLSGDIVRRAVKKDIEIHAVIY
jgi:hypothetical protein